MLTELARVPAQVLMDQGLFYSARVCLSLMYMRLDNQGFCPLTALELAHHQGTTDKHVRTLWYQLEQGGYITRHTIPETKVRRAVRGHWVALTQDGGAYQGFDADMVGTAKFFEENDGAA